MNFNNQTFSDGNNQAADPLDAQIDATLRTFGNALPPDGMQAGILRRVQQAQPGSASTFHLPIWKFAAVACGLALAAGIAINRHRAAVERDESAHASPIRLGITPEVTAQIPVRTQKADSHNIPNASPQAKLSLLATRDGYQPSATPVNATLPEDSAYAEMNAPSKPAPELPLTEEEKRMLAMGRPMPTEEQIAELHPTWPQHDPGADEEFRQFFQKPPIPHQPGDDK